jgi:CDP-diacylglycerol--serine O-phosphatidyltransferase
VPLTYVFLKRLKASDFGAVSGAAIIAVFQERFFYASVAILLAAVFDILDGKVARLSGATSKFGVQYDSLADLVSFGIAPALLSFSWALRPYGRFGWLAAFLFVVCGALRLARFNVQSSSGEVKYFKGLPIPAAASMVALTILLYLRLIETGWVKDIIILVMIWVLAFLMVSNIRYFSFKELDLSKRKPFNLFILVILTMIVLVAAFGIISTLVMLVMQKRKEIAVLKSMGASRGSIMGVFIVQGLIIGMAGTALGLLLGLLIAHTWTRSWRRW